MTERHPTRINQYARTADRPGASLLRLQVFVPGVMAVGVLVSLLVFLVDLVRRLATGRSYERQARLAADRVAAQGRAASAAHAASQQAPTRPDGFRPAQAYWLIAAIFIGVGIYVLIGSTYNYFFMPWIQDTAWVWAVSLLGAFSLGWIGLAAADAALRRERCSTFAWALLQRTPLGDS